MTTITASTTIGIDLNPASYTSPVVIDAGVTVSNPSYPYAIYRHSGATTVFAIHNSGIISGGSIGVYLAPGGSVTNATAGSIVGGRTAVKIFGGAGTVVNDGSISTVNGPGIGVELDAGGSVTNALSASIKGFQGVVVYGDTGIVNNGGVVSGGIRLGAGGTIVNSGTVSGDYGMLLDSGGSVTNVASGYINGSSDGIAIRADAGTVDNAGRIVGDLTFAGKAGVVLYAAGSVTNSGQIYGDTGVSISGAGNLTNDGTIKGGDGWGVSLASGGSVTNAVGAMIQGHYGIDISGAAGTLVNAGSITNEVLLAMGGSVTNAISASIGVSADYGNGLGITGATGAVVNNGTIAGNVAIFLRAGGSVTNGVSGDITGHIGASISGGVGTIINDGSISGFNNYAVTLLAGGSVTNANSAFIRDLGIRGGVGTVVNDGSIGGSYRSGVYFGAGGSVTNATGAVIENGIRIRGGSGTVINDNTIGGGVYFITGGSVINAAAASISGTNGIKILGGAGTVVNAIAASISGSTNGPSGSGYGVDLPAGGTITNAGTITGVAGTAVTFGGTGSNLLVLDPSYKFSGVVAGGVTASNTLELASAASAGAVTGLGTEFVHFGAIKFDAAAQWSISGIQRGLAGTISGFAIGDTIVMTGVTATGSSFAGGILTLDEAGGASATLDLPGTFTSASDFHVAPVAGGTEVTVACFRAGTRILTASGEVAVEELRTGDRVVTVCSHRIARVLWLGHRQIDCVRHPRPHDVWPVCIKAGAISDGVPHRDLWLSPEHAALFRDGMADVLVPVRHLLNGTTIIQVPCDTITYWHIELASHDAIVAEGLPAETYLDTGNRADFANGGAAVTVHPTFANAVWSARACAPQLRHGDALAALQYRLAIRAMRSSRVQHARSQIARSPPAARER